MIIEKINLQNFKNFKDTGISFSSPTETKYISLIIGNNGSGKTNFVNSINWCLYGDKFDRGPHILNADSAQNLKNEEITNVSVSIRLQESKGSFTVERIANFQRKDNEVIQIESSGKSSTLQISFSNKDEHLFGYEAEDYIQELIPKALIPYYITDGEYLNVRTLENLETIKKARVNRDLPLIRPRLDEIIKMLKIISIYEPRIKKASQLSQQCLSALNQFEQLLLSSIESKSADRHPSFYLEGIIPDSEIDNIYPKGNETSLSDGNLGILSAGERLLVMVKYIVSKGVDLGLLFPLVLDEPFSLLSPEAIRMALSTMKQLMKGRQVIILTCSPWFDIATSSPENDSVNIFKIEHHRLNGSIIC